MEDYITIFMALVFTTICMEMVFITIFMAVFILTVDSVDYTVGYMEDTVELEDYMVDTDKEFGDKIFIL